jgi:isocitrate dehydrogenase kinase/phosphatase
MNTSRTAALPSRKGPKERIINGHVHDVFPYEPVKRFAHHAEPQTRHAAGAN